MRTCRTQCVLNCALPVALCALAFVTGCRQSEQDAREVVVFVSADEYVATSVLEAFERETGVAVRMVGDTEAKKTTGLVERLRAEKNNPQADVFWSSEIFLTMKLADEGVFDEHLSDLAIDWPSEWTGRGRLWYAFGARARVLVYNPETLEANEIPDDWRDLTQERFRGRIAMADPRFGTTGGHLGAMQAYWDRKVGPGYYAAFVDALSDNDVMLLTSGNAGVVQAVITGEADIGMTDTDDVWAAQAQGYDVDLVYPRHDHPDVPGGGTLLIPNTVARVRGGPNPETAKLLIDFLLSETGERMLAESDSHNIPLRPGLADEFAEYAVPDPLDVNFETAARMRESAIETLMDRLEAGSERDEARGRVPARQDDDQAIDSDAGNGS